MTRLVFFLPLLLLVAARPDTATTDDYDYTDIYSEMTYYPTEGVINTTTTNSVITENPDEEIATSSATELSPLDQCKATCPLHFDECVASCSPNAPSNDDGTYCTKNCLDHLVNTVQCVVGCNYQFPL